MCEIDFVSKRNIKFAKSILSEVLDKCLNFKIRDKVGSHVESDQMASRYFEKVPRGSSNNEAIFQLLDQILDDSINFNSPSFLGFPDTGSSIAGLMGGLVEAVCQQNLLNSQFCARAGTFVECCTVNWLRELIGYSIADALSGVAELGGVATTGGTCSNMYALLMARQRAFPDSFEEGQGLGTGQAKVLVPGEITHYSIKGAAGLVGLGTKAIVDTTSFKRRVFFFKQLMISV